MSNSRGGREQPRRPAAFWTVCAILALSSLALSSLAQSRFAQSGFAGVIARAAVSQDEASKPAEEAEETAEGRIRALLACQVSSWNQGDIDGFMRGYWESPELTFSSGGEVTRGYEATRQRYHRRYATREQMGRLEFRDLEVRLIGDQAAYVLGDWELERAGGEQIGGKFTLVMGQVGGNWKILHDHTSSRD